MSLNPVAAQFIAQPLVVLQDKLKQSKSEEHLTAFCSAVACLANSLGEKLDHIGLGSLSAQLNNLSASPTQKSFVSMEEALQVIDDRFSKPNVNYRNTADVNVANANHVVTITDFRAARAKLLTAGKPLFG